MEARRFPSNRCDQAITHDSDRGRYLVRDCSLDPAKFARPIGDKWAEYLGDEPYRDFEVDVSGSPGNQTATAVPVRRYIRGYGLIAMEDENGGMQFIHGDLLGSTRLMTEGSDTQTLGEPTARGEYLAFGGVLDLSSLVSGTGVSPVVGIRYGWCGSWGYQTDALADLGESWSAGPVPTGGAATLADDELELGLLHIGARYYSPEIGRWVQRDQFGIEGGINVYEYVWSNPTRSVDPSGLTTLLDPIIEVTYHAAIRMQKRQVSYSALAQALKVANAIRVKFDEFQQLQALIFGSNGLTVVYQITGRYAGCVRTVWWQEP